MNIKLLDDVIRILAKGDKLPDKNFDHELSGNYVGYRECHIQPDWLLVYKVVKDKLILVLSATGSHH